MAPGTSPVHFHHIGRTSKDEGCFSQPDWPSTRICGGSPSTSGQSVPLESTCRNSAPPRRRLFRAPNQHNTRRHCTHTIGCHWLHAAHGRTASTKRVGRASLQSVPCFSFSCSTWNMVTFCDIHVFVFCGIRTNATGRGQARWAASSSSSSGTREPSRALMTSGFRSRRTSSDAPVVCPAPQCQN